MLIACVYCNQGAIPITFDQTAVQCPTCLRNYRLHTSYLINVDSSSMPSGQYRYYLNMRSLNGGVRPRMIRAQGGLPLKSGQLITLAYRGSRLIGISDQKAGMWYAVEPEKPNHPWVWSYAAFLSWAVLAIAALEAVRLVDASLQQPVLTIVVAVIALLFAASLPFLVPLLSRVGRQDRAVESVSAAAERMNAPMSEDEVRQLLQLTQNNQGEDPQ